MTQEDKVLAFQEFVAEDGLMCLGKNGQQIPYETATKKTCDNDNGILFMAEFYYLLNEHNLLEGVDQSRFITTMQALTVKRVDEVSPPDTSYIIYEGLYNRNPERNDRTEAHDNYIGIVAGAGLFNQTQFPQAIVRYGEQYGFIYDNIHPTETKDLTRLRTGSDVAYFKLIASYKPAIWEYAWFIGSFLLESFTMSLDNSSSPLIGWLQLKSLKDKNLSFVKLATWLWKRKLVKVTSGLGIQKMFEIYFGEDHPNTKFSKGIIF